MSAIGHDTKRMRALDADDRRLFEQATLPHLDAAYNLARWLTRNEHAAEDVVQEAYFRAARYFSSFRGGDAKPWLLGIVRRTSFDWLAERLSHPAVLFEEEQYQSDDESTNPEFQAIRKCEQELVRAALEELPPHLRETIVLREFEGMTYQEIASVTDVSIGTVMSRLSRARTRLQQRLGAELL